MKTPLRLTAVLTTSLFLLSFSMGLAASVGSGDGHFYWTGEVDSDYTNPANWRWSNNALADPSSLPATQPTVMPGRQDYNGNYNVHVHFPGNAVNKTVVFANNPKYNAAPMLQYIYLHDATGYVFSGVTPKGLSAINATGTGTIATLNWNAHPEMGAGTSTVSGGSIVFAKGFYLSGEVTHTFTGTDGTVTFQSSNRITGWSNKRVVAISGTTTVRVEGTPPFGGTNGKCISLNSAGAKLQYKNTVADAESRFGKNDNQSAGIINGYDTDNYALAATDMGDGYVEVFLRFLGTPELVATSFSKDGNDAFVASATIGTVSANVYAIADDGVNAPAVTTLGTDVAANGTASATLSGLAPGVTYSLSIAAENASGAVTNAVGAFYNGTPTLACVADAYEEGLIAGTVTVSRASASALPLTVAYTCAGTDAVAGQTYVALSGSITIPANAASADIALVPLADTSVSNDVTLVFSLAAGDSYKTVNAATASLVLHNASAYPADKNVWIATAASDGLASTAANWSKGVPTSTDDILVDGLYSSASMTWDAGVNGLPDTVASWTERNYAGTNTFLTEYMGTFTTFMVTGDCTLSSGTWTHLANASAQTHRLSVAVGGDFVLGADAKLDAYRKGYAANQFPAGGAAGVHAGGRHSLLCTYGNVAQPEDIGAGGAQLPGGGAIKVVVTGDAVIDGAIDVSAGKNTGPWSAVQCGAPGSVYLQAASVTGTGSIDAAAPQYFAADAASPSGGRVAIRLTQAQTLGLPVANIATSGTLGRGLSSSGGGTLLVRTSGQTYGTLHVKNNLRDIGGTYGIKIPDRYGTTLIPPGETWTLDGIVFSAAGILAVPAGTTLRLPHGFASVTGSSRNAGILALGGTIDAGAEDPYVLQGGWVFHAETPYTFDRDTVVTNGAAIGLVRLYCVTNSIRRSTVTVQGNLTVASDAYLYASGSGLNDSGDGNPRFGETFSHGGMPGIFGTRADAVYGSVLHPSLPGVFGHFDDSASQYVGGGALAVTVTGCLTLDGQALSLGCPYAESYNSGGSGGSLDLTAGSIAGTGIVSANGHNCQQNASKIADDQVAKMHNRGVISCSGGGRIAIRLTDAAATFPADFINRATAYGGYYTYGNHREGTATNTMCSAGTVYLQSGAEGEGMGTVYIRNGSHDFNTSPHTPFPSLTHGGERDDLHGVTLAVGGLSRVALTKTTKVAQLTMDAGTVLDLCGGTLTVARAELGGVRLAKATYSAGDEATGAFLADSSSEGTGRLVVLGDFTMVLIQ